MVETEIEECTICGSLCDLTSCTYCGEVLCHDCRDDHEPECDDRDQD